MLVAHVWLQQQKQICRLRDVHAGYVFYRALFFVTVHHMVKIINIVCIQPIGHIDAGA